MSSSSVAAPPKNLSHENNFVESTLVESKRPTWAEIDADALRSNLACVRRLANTKNSGNLISIAPAVKADAYGHEAALCARVLETAGTEWLCVALPEEGFALRAAGIKIPILSLGGFYPGQQAACLSKRIVPVLYRADMAESYNRAARERGIVADIHIKVDTGMNRLGVPYDLLGEFVETLKTCANLRVDGLMTHFAAADEAAQNDFTHRQFAKYRAAVELLAARGFKPRYFDLANSAAIFSHLETRGNMVRPGGVIYGLWRDVLQAELNDETKNNNQKNKVSDNTSDKVKHEAKDDTDASDKAADESLIKVNPRELRQVMSVRSRIVLLKEVEIGETVGYGCSFRAARRTLVATVPIGYHDGVPRALSNRGRVLVRGQFAPIVGRVSMDLITVDVTDINRVSLWDTVTFIGRDGAHQITAEEIGKLAHTFSYEITCGISARVPRVLV